MIRQKLTQLRKNRGLKQKDVALAIGITTSYYGMIEQGIRKPSLDIAGSIARFFNEEIDEIFFDNINNSIVVWKE